MTGKNQSGETFLCAALVRLRLRGARRGRRNHGAVLEGISPDTASLLTERPIAEESELDLLCGTCSLRGKVRECRFYGQLGYGVTVDFEPESRWSAELYRPAHMTSPSKVKGCSCRGAAACRIRAAHEPSPELPLEERVRTAGSKTAVVSAGMTDAELRRCFACFFDLPPRSALFRVFAGSYRETERAIDAGGTHENAAAVLARLAKVLGAECGDYSR